MTDRETLLETLATCGIDAPTHQTVHQLLQVLVDWEPGDDEQLTHSLQSALWRTRPQPGA